MKPLGLKLRIDDLSHEGRPFVGELPAALLGQILPGLVGTLGYRVDGPALISGTAYRSHGGEIIIDGRLTARVGFDCVRCLTPRTLEVALRADHVFVRATKPAPKPATKAGTKPATKAEDEVVVDASDEDDDVLVYHGDEVDLTETFREDLLLELPMNPSCEDVHAEGCEVRVPARAVGPVDTVDTVDPRWAPLAELKKQLGAVRGEGSNEPNES